MSSAKSESSQASFKEIMDKAAKSAIRGGTAGACAMGANVACLMWMRTTVSCHALRSQYHSELFVHFNCMRGRGWGGL